jgi:predicted  nucleic acid-binding Zn-ribbon protein
MEAQLETTEVKTASLGGLEQSVQRAVATIADLRAQKRRLEKSVSELKTRCMDLEHQLEAQKRDSSLLELKQLRAAEKAWQEERDEIAEQIDGAVQKLQDMES